VVLKTHQNGTPVDFSISSGRANEYAPGYEVDGIKWKPEFSKHAIGIQNKSISVEIHNLRVALVLPGPIINYKESSRVGVNQMNIRRIGITGAWYTDEQWRIIAPRKIYSNAIFIEIDKLTYESFVDVEFIINLNRKDFSYTMSILDAKYYYSAGNGKKAFSKSETYNIKKKDSRNVLYIDLANRLSHSPLSFDYTHSFSSLLEENTDVEDPENKHFQIEAQYPFPIPPDKQGKISVTYPPYVGSEVK
jgi:hypothetical protein